MDFSTVDMDGPPGLALAQPVAYPSSSVSPVLPARPSRSAALAGATTGTASTAPTTPPADTPMRAAVMVAGGDSLTDRPTTSGLRMWFSNCRYTTKNTAQTTPVVALRLTPSRTNGTPPAAPPIWGTRSNRATQM